MSAVVVTNPEFVNEAVRCFREQAPTCTSARELAELERILWEQVREHISGPAEGRKQRWWDEAVGDRNAASFRWALLTRGDRVQALWDCIDKQQITLRTAFKLLMEMERGRSTLDQLIAAHLKLPTVVRSGRPYRRSERSRSGEGQVASARVSVSAAPAVPPAVERGVDAESAEAPAEGLDDWKSLRKTFEATVERLVVGVSEPRRSRLRREFKVEVSLLIESMSRRLYLEKNSIDEQVRHRDLVEACEVLNVTPPRRGCLVDDKTRTAALRNYRRFARHYHPDLRGGDETRRHLLERVVRAWDVINNWNTASGAVRHRAASCDERKGEQNHGS